VTKEKTFQIKVPGSTSNLGAGFDCFGLALQLYLTVEVSCLDYEADEPFRITVDRAGEPGGISTDRDNLILATARDTVESLGKELPAVQLSINNEIPLGRGLGSSAAAIVAGVAIGARLCGFELATEELLSRAAVIEGHADNAAAAVVGGRVICYQDTENVFRAIRLPWPEHIRAIVVSPELPLATKEARGVLPELVSRDTAVFNLQRTALLTAALDHGADDEIWEAMRDRLHQPFREGLVPGLAAALAVPQQEGLLGLALSGAGPSIVALASDRFEEIGQTISAAFGDAGVKCSIRVLGVDDEGFQISG
jgi:homoserine kinase